MTGYIAEPGADAYRHLFGGAGWTMVAPPGASPLPTLVLMLDLGDARLGLGRSSGALPLCAHLDGSNLDRQHYSFDPVLKKVAFDGPAWHDDTDPDDYLPNPLPEHPLRLRPLREAEDPRVTDKYDVHDTFLGDVAFLRIGGDPLWLQHPEEVACTSCGAEQTPAACVGYESESQPSGLVSASEPFFLGEFALYFFACFGCNRVSVLSQST